MMWLMGWWAAADASESGGAPPAVAAPVCRAEEPAARRDVRAAARSDQADRRRARWDGLEERDAARLSVARAAVAGGLICSPAMAFDAARVLQHSARSADHRDAYHLSGWACAEGLEAACGWVGLAWDRHLVSAGRPQWFGTQRQVEHADDGSTTRGCLMAVDAAATDADRARHGQPSLADAARALLEQLGREVPPDVGYPSLVAAGLVCEPSPWVE